MSNPTLLLRRYLECTGFVLLWMMAEHYLRLRPIPSQLLGIPFIAIFQLAVARRPLAQIWARDAEEFRVDRRTVEIAAALTFGCGVLLSLSNGRAVGGPWQKASLLVLVAASALPAAFALRQQRAAAFRRALPMLLLAVAFRIGLYAAWHDGAVLIQAERWADFFATWLCEFVALFLVDEVVFRGVLDPHLLGAAKGRLHAWCSALFVSILWSVWHLPAYNPDATSFLALFDHITMFHLSVLVLGVLLTFCARAARTLVPTSITHAFGNAHILAMIK